MADGRPRSQTILVVGPGIAVITAARERGGEYDTYDDPAFLDDFIAACGAEAVDYDVKTSCRGGSVSVTSRDKTLHLIGRFVAEAVNAGSDVIATPCPSCQTKVEMYRDAVDRKFGTDFDIPVVSTAS